MFGTGLKVSRWALVAPSVITFFVLCLILTAGRATAQVVTATLSGTVADKDDAIIPGAKVTVTNRGNKASRSVVSNGSGVFTFPGLDSGDFVLLITFPGFQQYKVEGIHLNPGDARSINTIRMVPGASDIVVNVDSTGQNVVGDDGARDFIITSADLNKLSLQGREVTELLKILPGSAINNGANGNSAISNHSFDPGTVTFGGASSSYSVSGAPINGAAIRSDGANLTDPGTGAGSLQTINAEATAEVKIQTSNFGADNANGPMVINAVGKAGQSDYHGSVYSYGRTGQLNSTDSIASLLKTKKPDDRFIYPGASLGGPVKIPGTNFNHDKKLVFFVTGEDYIQRNVYSYNGASDSVTHALVPTAAMRHGDFSAAQITKHVADEVRQYICVPDDHPDSKCQDLQLVPSQTFGGTLQSWSNLAVVPAGDASGNQISCKGVPGDCLAGHEDAGALAQQNLIPLPNLPGGITNPLGYNYTRVNVVNSDIYEVHGRLDYSEGRSKFYLTYTAENGKTNVPQALGYFASGDDGGINTPGGTTRQTYTGSGSANWNISFSPTLTNEAFASGLYSDQINQAAKPELLLNSAIGYPYGGAYDNGTKQFPNLNTYSRSGGYPLGIFPDFSYGALFNKTFAPGIGDNLTKQLGKHTVRVGVNVERPRINGTQTNGTATNGEISNYYVGPQFQLPNLTTASGEPYGVYHSTCFQFRDTNCQISNNNSNNLANYFVGEFSNYAQGNIIPKIRMHAWTTSMYVTDDYKVLRNVSITLGLRVEHIGRWIDDHGFGSAIFSPTDYANESDNLNNPKIPLPGFRWHSNDATVPISGFQTREFFYEPRVGFNWDVYGSGKTSVTGGWGQYRFRDGQQDAINSVTASNGYRSVQVQGKGPDPQGPPEGGASFSQGGLTQAYVQSLHLSPVPGVASSTFFAGNYGGSPNYASASNEFYAVNQNDSQVPLTTNYSLTVTQQLPQALTFSIAYVGNHSGYLLNDTYGGPTTANINSIPLGGFFQPDPNVQSSFYGRTYAIVNLGNAGAFSTNDYRKYPRYRNIQVESHALKANYNAMQITLERTKGAAYLKANYTWSKNQGQRGGYQNGNAGDSFNVNNNYGPLAYDRTNIANVSYNYDFGSRYHGYRALQPVLNGWHVSGIVNLQSGPNLLAINGTTNFNLGGTIKAPVGQQDYYLGSTPYLGTPDINLQPILTCDPTAHLAKRQYVSPDCFTVPKPGGFNGSFHVPYIHGPAFFQADATVVKDFKIREKQNIEFRAAGFNFLNYKLKTFTNLATPALNLIFSPQGFGTEFGKSRYNSGRRVMELAVKYTF